MKNKLTAILALFLCTTFANAQDLIQLKSGKTEEVQILEINKEKIKFKKFKNLNGPTYSAVREGRKHQVRERDDDEPGRRGPACCCPRS